MFTPRCYTDGYTDGFPGRDDVQVTPCGLSGRDDAQVEEMGSENPIEPAQTWSQKEEQKKALDQERNEGNGTFQLRKNVGFPPCVYGELCMRHRVPICSPKTSPA